MSIRLAESDADIARCWPVIAELRPHLADADDLVARVRRQQREGYRLAFVESEGRAVACAGFRAIEMLSRGRHLYVDDLATLESERSKGHGERLLAWLRALAKEEGCARLHLDSGTQRRQAHKFYFRNGLTVDAFHFGMGLDEGG